MHGNSLPQFLDRHSFCAATAEPRLPTPSSFCFPREVPLRPIAVRGVVREAWGMLREVSQEFEHLAQEFEHLAQEIESLAGNVGNLPRTPRMCAGRRAPTIRLTLCAHVSNFCWEEEPQRHGLSGFPRRSCCAH